MKNIIRVAALCISSALIIGLCGFLFTYEYVDMCDPFNQGGYAMACYYGDKESCDLLEAMQNQCKQDGDTVASGWYKR